MKRTTAEVTGHCGDHEELCLVARDPVQYKAPRTLSPRGR